MRLYLSIFAALCLAALPVLAQDLGLPPARTTPPATKRYHLVVPHVQQGVAVVSTLVSAMPEAVKTYVAPTAVRVHVQITVTEEMPLLTEATGALEPAARPRPPRHRNYELDTTAAQGQVIYLRIGAALPQAVKDYVAEVELTATLTITVTAVE